MTASVPSIEKVRPSAVITTKEELPGAKVVLASSTPPGPKVTGTCADPMVVVISGAFEPIRYVVPPTTAMLLPTENVKPSVVYTTNGESVTPPGATVVLGKPRPPAPIEMLVPATTTVVAGAPEPTLYVVPEMIAAVGPTVSVRSLTVVVMVADIAAVTTSSRCA